MVRKSAAKVKPIKTNNSSKFLKHEDLPPIEETWNNIKQVITNTAEVQVVVAKRVENLANIRLASYKFFGNELDSRFLPRERMEYFKKLHTMTIEIYEKIFAIVKEWELEEFLKEDMKDYFEDIIPSVDSIEFEDDLLEATLIVDCVKPWGEKMMQLHQQMLDEQAQRKALEVEKPESELGE